MFSVLHSFVPESILFSIGSFSVHWYGLFAALGIAMAWMTIEHLQKQYGIKRDLSPLFIGTIIAGIIGARLYHILNEFSFYFTHPVLVPQLWNGGLALHGGIIGAMLYVWYWTKKNKLLLGRVVDIFATGGILIQIFGRFGNYFNQELFGTPTDLPWGIPIGPLFRPQGYESFVYFHPSFLYEALLNILLFVVLLTLHKAVIRGTLHLKEGYIFLLYLFFYSIIRIVNESIRIDMTPLIYGIRLPILVSGIILVVVLGYIYKVSYAKT